MIGSSAVPAITIDGTDEIDDDIAKLESWMDEQRL